MNYLDRKLMKARRVTSVDRETGEVLEGVIVYCGVKRNPYAKGWVMNSQESLKLLATDRDLKGETYRVLLLLLSQLDFENWIQITQKEISEILEMKKSQVSRAITILEGKEIILRGPKVGHSYAFRLNPYFGWKGKVKNLDDYRRKEHDNWAREQLRKNDKPEQIK